MTNPVRRKTFFVLWAAFAVFFIFTQSAFAEERVRVLVGEKQKSLRIKVQGGYALKAVPSQGLIRKGKGLDAVLVPTPRGIRIGSEEFAVQGLRVEPAEDRDLFLNQSRFRGIVTVSKDAAGLFYAVNELGIEKYLYGVLHHEVAAWWPMEALRAQAIAARSYALFEARGRKGQAYHLKSSTSSQVYGGSTTERLRTKRAVDETRGQVLTFQNKVFPAYFHATCGGRTAGAAELWKINIVPLAGSVACGFCKISPHYRWSSRIPLIEIEQKMKKNGRSVGQILNLEAISRTPSGRVGSLRITGTERETIMAAKDFRIWMGGDKLRSTSFAVTIQEDAALLEGHGWGHGVGLCQWGTLGQALLGHTHEVILKFYYPSSEITDYET